MEKPLPLLIKRLKVAFCIIFLITGCNTAERLSRIGRVQELQDVSTYEDEIYDDYATRGISFGVSDDPVKKANAGMGGEVKTTRTANSLWRPGGRTFFRDQRARSVGDILKIIVTIQDQAKLQNNTQSGRKDTEATSAPNVLGLETHIKDVLPKAVNPASLINISSNDANSGFGTVNRSETINTTIAATVVKILPSNNLVIKGIQEIRVNNEVREMVVEGVVRPEDISAQNSVTLDQVAEARVIYGGRGIISDYQQPRYGKQLLEILSPF